MQLSSYIFYTMVSVSVILAVANSTLHFGQKIVVRGGHSIYKGEEPKICQ